MPRSKVIVDTKGFKRFEADLQHAIDQGLVASGHDVVAEAQQVGTTYKIGHITATARVGQPVRGVHSTTVDVFWPDYRAMWFIKGTYRRLGASRRGGGEGGNRGVKPVRFPQKAVKEVFPRIVARIAAAVR